MIGGGDHDEVVPGDQFDRETWIREFFFGTLDKAEFDVAADYSLDDLRRVADRNHQGDARMGLVKFDQSRRQEMARYRLAGLDLEKSARKTGELAHR